MCSLLFFLAIELELVIGLSSLAAGIALLPLALSLAAASPIVGRLADRGATRASLVGGALLLGGSQAALALQLQASLIAPIVGTAVTGVALAFCSTAATAAALQQTPRTRLGEVAATLAAARMIGLAAGVALMAAIAARSWPNGVMTDTAIPSGVATGLAINAMLAFAAAGIAWLGLSPGHAPSSPQPQTDFI